MDRGDKIFIGAIAGAVVGAGVVGTRRRRRVDPVGEPGPLDPVDTSERQRFLGEPCERCGARAGVRKRQGTRLEPRVLQGGPLRYPVLQDHRVFYTYLACRACGAER